MSAILVTGGCGYIGSHMVRLLESNGERVTALDNLSTGNAWSVQSSETLVGDLLDLEFVRNVFKKYAIKGVYHFAASSLVSESQQDPIKYHETNIQGSINLLKAMVENSVNKIVFSSSAAVYGNADTNCISESASIEPINPYGETKRVVEKLLSSLHYSNEISSVSFRYFNAAGASEEASIGEAHFPETHLIPRVLNSVLDCNDSEMSIYGSDYATEDGTCVRDYVHVDDICKAHLLGMEYLANSKGAHILNIGAGKGYSVLDVIEAAQEVTGKTITPRFLERRRGDPPRLVSDITKIQSSLGWSPQASELKDILRSAWKWHNSDTYRRLLLDDSID